jgi:uncharacterized protein YxeA
MRGKMADDKKTIGDDQPTFVIAAPQMADAPKKSRLTRKHVLIAVVSLVITALVVIGVLVAIRIYTDSNLETLKLQYSMTMKDKNNNDVTQNVSADANIVQYHVVKDGTEAWIIHDFDKELEISKVKTDNGISCFVSALNRSNAQEPKSIPTTAPQPGDNTPTKQLVYKVSETPIADIKFLGQRASSMCNNIPTYWMVPSCDNGASQMPMNTTAPADRSKRATVCATCGGYSCVCGCCWAICGRFASSTYTWTYINGVYTCTYRMYYLSCSVYLGSYNCFLGGRQYYYPWS